VREVAGFNRIDFEPGTDLLNDPAGGVGGGEVDQLEFVSH
jgi:hypothetical protein